MLLGEPSLCRIISQNCTLFMSHAHSRFTRTPNQSLLLAVNRPYIQQAATTLKPLMADFNNLDQLTTLAPVSRWGMLKLSTPTEEPHKGSAVNILVPHTTTYLPQTCEALWLKGDPQHIRQVVIILWLIAVHTVRKLRYMLYSNASIH